MTLDCLRGFLGIHFFFFSEKNYYLLGLYALGNPMLNDLVFCSYLFQIGVWENIFAIVVVGLFGDVE
jgi:hypothetical protein